jgi:phosphatidylserine/phosphatidylglycerophosphate/cardiolipin synthase-like enzyme
MSDGFDLKTLLKFSPPDLICENCLGLWRLSAAQAGRVERSDAVSCKLCNVAYKAKNRSIRAYLHDKGLEIHFDDPFAHARELAELAMTYETLKKLRADFADMFSPMNTLFQSLAKAQQFVHFISYGISPMLIGALKMTSLRVPVRGIVSNVSGMALDELKADAHEAPQFTVRYYERSDKPSDWQASPHQKLIVIDGLLAFKGSANLTTDGWRKAAAGQDHIEVVTNINEVVTLHNDLFSPQWAKFSDIGDIIDTDEIPF